MNSISIIIPTHNSQKFIGDLLKTIVDQNNHNIQEVIVVDSGDDKTSSIACSHENSFKGCEVTLKVIKVPNLGVSYSRNFGAKIATSSLLFFVDGDCLLKKNTISNIIEFFIDFKRRGEAIGAVQCKTLFRRKEFFDRIASAGVDISKLGYGWGRLNLYPKDSSKANNSREVIGMEGTGFLIERNIYLNVGGFDEYFFYYSEASDLSLKLNLRGYKIFYSPLAEIYDFKGGSRLYKNVDERMKLFIKYHLACLLKFYPLRYLVFILPLALAIDIAIAFMIGVRYRSLRPFFAFVEIIREFPILMKKRKYVKRMSKIGFREIWGRMSSIKQDTIRLMSSARYYGWLK